MDEPWTRKGCYLQFTKDEPEDPDQARPVKLICFNSDGEKSQVQVGCLCGGDFKGCPSTGEPCRKVLQEGCALPDYWRTPTVIVRHNACGECWDGHMCGWIFKMGCQAVQQGSIRVPQVATLAQVVIRLIRYSQAIGQYHNFQDEGYCRFLFPFYKICGKEKTSVKCPLCLHRGPEIVVRFPILDTNVTCEVCSASLKVFFDWLAVGERELGVEVKRIVT